MDIRSIIDSDTSIPTQGRSRPAPTQQPEQRQEYRQHPQSFQNPYDAHPPAHNGRRETRPPQPPPLQPPIHNDLRSPASSYDSMPSPYQHTSSSTLSGGQYPFPQHTSQSPAHGYQGPPYPQREGVTTSINTVYQPYKRSTPLPQTPTATTPGSAHAYAQYPRPQSSHSTSTPASASYQVTNLLQDSPQASHSQTRPPSQPHSSQQYHSQPGTPLGPPSAFGRPSTGVQRESPGFYEYQRSQSGGSFGQQQGLAPSPTTELSASSNPSPLPYGSRQSQAASHIYSSISDRERSLSVSPKTRLPNQPKIELMEVSSQQARAFSGQVTPAKRKIEQDRSDEQYSYTQPATQGQVRAISLGANGILNASQVDNINKDLKENPSVEPQPLHSLENVAGGMSDQLSKSQHNRHAPSFINISSPAPIHIPVSSSRPVSRGMPISGSSSVTPSGQQPLTPLLPSNQQSPISVTTTIPSTSLPKASSSAPPAPPASIAQQSATRNNPETSAVCTSSPPQPVRKRPRYDEPPIFAQSVRHKGRGVGSNTLLSNQRQALGKNVSTNVKDSSAQSLAKPQGKQETNGYSVGSVSNDVPLFKAQPELGNRGPLGVWEVSITNVTPHEELTKIIADFLFTEVVLREDVGAGPAGGGEGQGAVLEIEAKIGHLIDKNTNDRLRLPIMTESVIDNRDPNLRVNFQSSMTEASLSHLKENLGNYQMLIALALQAQHRSLNQFLNAALVESQPKVPAAKPRIPMSYVHTYECDTFYELSQSGSLTLPPSIRAQTNTRHQTKVRITTDQKTGKELAKIVKVRVADINVYSPRTAFDWRVSVNLEMNFTGDMKSLVNPVSMDNKRPDRNKDRLSYRHLAYQIDLTQVSPAEATSKTEKEHELEIEISSAEVRRQGLLARDGHTSQYEDLIKGFVDNVRILARHCPLI